MSRRTYYQVLGVAPGSQPRAIHKAYRRSVRQVHPDVNPSPEALERFYELQRAYDALKNSRARAGYDVLIGAQRPETPAPTATQRTFTRRPAIMFSRRSRRRRRRNRLVLGVLVAMNLALVGATAYVIWTQWIAPPVSAPVQEHYDPPPPLI